MKFVAMGDLHLTNKKPSARTDKDYLFTILKKLDYIYKKAVILGAPVVVQPGDFFDSSKASDFLKSLMILKLREYKQRFNISTLTIFGQHDLRFHSSDIKNTPLAVLESAKNLNIIPNKKPITINNVNFYGSSWNEEPVIPKEGCNVLVIHRMIIKGKIWEKQEDFIYGPNIFRKYPKYNYFITGDNHQHFTYNVKPKNKPERYLINCGSLMRSTIAQIAHEPCFYLIDTDKNKIKKYKIPIEKSDIVFNMDKIELKKEMDTDLENFITAIKKQTEGEAKTLNFINALNITVKKENTEIQEEIKTILNSIKE